MDILRKRSDIPKVIRVADVDRLVILPDEAREKTTAAGRPIGSEYWSVESKLRFMEIHNIDASVISLANVSSICLA
jgi:aminocarboxymuconate-semialdehyde decarboxylase